MLEISKSSVLGTWRDVADSANTTVNKAEGIKEPPSSWKRRILLAEHSPIRQMFFKWKWENLLSWVSVHFVRHKIGIEHFVRSQRTDRTGIDRNILTQGELISHECIADFQAMINISRKRLCNLASLETREAWEKVLEKIKTKEPELYSVCVKECVYRGFCPEMKSCGFSKTSEYENLRKNYIGV